MGYTYSNRESPDANKVLNLKTNDYLVVKFVANSIDIYRIKAETASTAIIMTKRLHTPNKRIYLDIGEYGEGIVAIKVDSLKHEQSIINNLSNIFHFNINNQFN